MTTHLIVVTIQNIVDEYLVLVCLVSPKLSGLGIDEQRTHLI